jgi:hypothetical protein
MVIKIEAPEVVQAFISAAPVHLLSLALVIMALAVLILAWRKK